MNYDYLSLISIKTINGKIMFKLEDVEKYLVNDLKSIIDKANYIINISIDNSYINVYTLILLIVFSNDYRTFGYKFFLIYSTIDKLNDLINPESIFDKAKTLSYLNNEYNYLYKKNNIDNNLGDNCIKNIIYREIENSFNIDIIRQII